MVYGLPGRGDPLWDTKLNESIAAVKETADAVPETVAADIEGGVGPVATALSATFASKGAASIDMCRGSYNCRPDEDVTARLQAAINALAALGGGDIYFSILGRYYVDGVAQTGTALGYSYNGQILFPAVDWLNKPNTPIRIRGGVAASSGAPSTSQANGVILENRYRAGTYMFDTVPYADQWGWHWTGVMPIFENIIIRTPTGGSGGGINALCAIRARFERVQVDIPESPGLQPSGTLMGIVGPHGMSNGDVTFRDVNVRGLHSGIGLTEHGVYDNIEIIGCENAFESGSAAHACWFGYVDVEQCHNVFKINTGDIVVVNGSLDVEMAGVSSGAWNAPMHLIAPGNSALAGSLSLRVVGSPEGGLALGTDGYNLDTALLFTSSGDRGGLGGWRSKHPSDNFKRLQNHALPAGNGGQCWPSLHPWRNVSNQVIVTTGSQMKASSGTGTTRTVVPTLRGGISRRVSLTTTLAASGYNVELLAHRVAGGTNSGNMILLRANSGNLTLTIAGTTVATVSGVTGGVSTTLALDLVYGPDKLPSVVRAYQDGVLKASATLTAAQAALLVPDTATYPYVEDGIGFTNDSASAATSFVVTDIPSATPTIVGTKVTRTAALTVTTSTFTDLGWDTELWDSNGFHDTTTSTERITIPPGCGGYYNIQAEYAISTPVPTSGRFLMQITVNNTAIPGGSSEVAGGGGIYPSLNAATVAKLVPGDIVRLRIYQTTGADSAIDTSRCSLAVTKIAD